MNFNLTSEPWIPVLAEADSGLGRREVSLLELFESAERIRDLALSPLERVAVMRLLVCITQAALQGPEDHEDWRRCLTKIKPEVSAYLQKWAPRFDLFGPFPFLQVKNLEGKADTRCAKLDIRLASGNNHTLFDHQDPEKPRRLEPKQLALNLLTYQCFSAGGLISLAKWGSEPTGTNRSSTQAPCAEGTPLLTILRGKNLSETIHYNLVPKKIVEKYLDPLGQEFGVPVWEIDPPATRSEAIHKLSRSYLGRLVPLSRAILIQEDCTHCILANGVEYPKLPEGIESLATVMATDATKKGKETWQYLRLTPEKHPWRDLGAVLALGQVGRLGSPWTLYNAKFLDLDPQSTVDLWVGGIIADRSKYLDVGEWVFAVPVALFVEGALEKYSRGVEYADLTQANLRDAVRAYCSELNIESAGPNRNAKLRYWSQLDQEYPLLIHIASYQSDIGKWENVCNQAAFSSLRESCFAQTPRQILALAKAQRVLSVLVSKKWKKAQPQGARQ